VRRVDRASKTRLAHLIHVRHRDEVEAPITDWLKEAYDLQAKTMQPKPARKPKGRTRLRPARATPGRARRQRRRRRSS
jgi:hypothetical protein